MKYIVDEVYTPDDTKLNRSPATFSFESDSTDILELAYLARLACYSAPVTEPVKLSIELALHDSDVADQLDGCHIHEFEFTIIGPYGEWELKVKADV